MKKVSVIIPVYRVEKYISAAITSVIEQSYENFELIIVDDGSPDQSVEICKQFTDSRIKIIHQENRGLAGARNTGIRHAKGEYIAFLDGDDMWLPEKLEKHVEHLENHPKLGVSFTPSAFIDEGGNPTGTYLRPRLKEIDGPYLLRENPMGNGSAAVIRREVFEAVEFKDNLRGTVEEFYFDEQFRQGEDIDFWLRIAIQTNWLIEGIPEALTLYRVNSGGLSASLLKQLEALEKVLEKTRSYAPELMAQWEVPSKAYLLRYLARSAIRRQDGLMAVKFMNRALAGYWQLIHEEPRRTIITLTAAYLLWLLPRPFYCKLRSITFELKRAVLKRDLQQTQTSQPI